VPIVWRKFELRRVVTILMEMGYQAIKWGPERDEICRRASMYIGTVTDEMMICKVEEEVEL